MRRYSRPAGRSPLASLLFSTFLSAFVWAGDHDKLEEGLPIRTESAYPIPYLGRELQALARYRRGHDGADSGHFEGRIEFGFPRNGELLATLPLEFAEGEPDGLREVSVEFLYNLNQETLVLPAFSLVASADLPTGRESHGVDPGVKALLTKTVGPLSRYQQLHLNFGWTFNDDVQRDEQQGLYEVVLGFSRRVTTSLMFVADIVREEDRVDDVERNLAELGLRYQLTPLTVISGAVGVGFGDESPEVEVTFGVQYAF